METAGRERELSKLLGDGPGEVNAPVRPCSTPTPAEAAAGLRREIEKVRRMNRWFYDFNGGDS